MRNHLLVGRLVIPTAFDNPVKTPHSVCVASGCPGRFCWALCEVSLHSNIAKGSLGMLLAVSPQRSRKKPARRFVEVSPSLPRAIGLSAVSPEAPLSHLLAKYLHDDSA